MAPFSNSRIRHWL